METGFTFNKKQNYILLTDKQELNNILFTVWAYEVDSPYSVYFDNSLININITINISDF
jgi:hypothetical protein